MGCGAACPSHGGLVAHEFGYGFTPDEAIRSFHFRWRAIRGIEVEDGGVVLERLDAEIELLAMQGLFERMKQEPYSRWLRIAFIKEILVLAIGLASGSFSVVNSVIAAWTNTQPLEVLPLLYWCSLAAAWLAWWGERAKRLDSSVMKKPRLVAIMFYQVFGAIRETICIFPFRIRDGHRIRGGHGV